jgi:hypothetical protein
MDGKMTEMTEGWEEEGVSGRGGEGASATHGVLMMLKGVWENEEVRK